MTDVTASSKSLALVIGSGSVKCAAAIGLVNVLQRQGIDLGIVVGCSGGRTTAIHQTAFGIDTPNTAMHTINLDVPTRLSSVISKKSKTHNVMYAHLSHVLAIKGHSHLYTPFRFSDNARNRIACLLMKKNLVHDWMTLNPITIGPLVTLPEAQRLMRDQKIRRLPVVDRGRLVGIVTLGDIRGAEPSEASTLSIFEAHYLLAKVTIEKIMTWEPITIRPDATIRQAAQLMLEHKIGGLPVVDNDKLVGIITESDVFRVLVQESDPTPA